MPRRSAGLPRRPFGPPPRDDAAKVRPREKPSKANSMLLPAFHADSFSCEIWRSVNEPQDQDAFPDFVVDDPIHETISEADTEAKVVVAVAGRVVVALGGAQVRPGVVPGATAFDPVRARCPRLAPKIIHSMNLIHAPVCKAERLERLANPKRHWCLCCNSSSVIIPSSASHCKERIFLKNLVLALLSASIRKGCTR